MQYMINTFHSFTTLLFAYLPILSMLIAQLKYRTRSKQRYKTYRAFGTNHNRKTIYLILQKEKIIVTFIFHVYNFFFENLNRCLTKKNLVV
jgi:hypothetical protein